MYNTLMKTSPEVILVAARDGTILEVSHQFMEQFACGSRGEILETSLFDRVAPEYQAKARSTLEKTHQDGKVWKQELRFLRHDGTSFIGEAYAARVESGSGQQEAVILSVRDITDKVIASAKIRESEERFRSIFEGCLDAIFIADPETGKILDANPAAAEMLMLPLEKIRGLRQWEIYPPSQQTEEEKRFHEYVLDRAPGSPEEKVLIRSDGFRVHTELLSQILQLDGIPVLYSTFRDITRRRKMEEEKKESEFQFRNLSDHSPNMIFINQKGRVVYVNRKCEEIMGYSFEEFTAPDFQFLSLMWEDSRERAGENFRRHMGGEEVPPTEYTMLTKEGKKIDGILATRIIQYQGEQAILGIVTDITERKATETALAESEQMYRALIRTSPDSIIVTDPAGTITEVSSHTVDQFGCGSPQELTGGDLRARIAPEARETMDKALGKALERGSFRNLELPLVRRDGTTFLGEVNVSVVRDLQQTPSSLIFAVRDIEQRRQLEADLARIERLESLGVLAGGIAHDFNNILTAISTNISMAQMFGNPDEETSKMLIDAETAATRARTLTQQLLTFSKGGLPVKKPISLSRLLVETTEFTLSGSNVICRYDIPEDLLAVEADEGQISQMIQNLIINADQAMPEGGTIRIRAKNLMEQDGDSALVRKGNHVRISIVDQGTGIPAKHLNRIFDPFFTTKYKGSGLGLSTTFSIVNNHAGHIRVKSEAGQGTTFTIILPATDKPVEPGPDRKAPPGKKEGRILIIDDDDMVRRSAGKTLRRLGYSVSFAPDGAKGIETYNRAMEKGTPFDAVIMDVTIPGGMGGKEAIAELLKKHPKARAIVSSGYSNDPVMAHYREYGFLGVIKKPYKIHELGDAVEKVIRGDSSEEGS